MQRDNKQDYYENTFHGSSGSVSSSQDISSSHEELNDPKDYIYLKMINNAICKQNEVGEVGEEEEKGGPYNSGEEDEDEEGTHYESVGADSLNELVDGQSTDDISVYEDDENYSIGSSRSSEGDQTVQSDAYSVKSGFTVYSGFSVESVGR